MTSCIIIVRGYGGLDRCLDSLGGIEEVVVLDNGMERSEHRVRSNEVYVHWPLGLRLGVLRNIGIEYSGGSQILSMDADEIFSGGLPPEGHVWSIEVRGYTRDFDGGGFFRKKLVRSFPRGHWVGGVHEYPEIEGYIREWNGCHFINLGYDIGQVAWERKARDYEDRIMQELWGRDDYLLYKQLEKSLKLRGVKSEFIEEQIGRLHEQNKIRRAEGFAAGGILKGEEV